MRCLPVVMLVLAAPPALANDASPDAEPDDPSPLPIEIGVYGGGFISNYYHQFYSTAAFPGGPGDPDQREQLRRVSPLTGVRFAYFAQPWLGFEGELGVIFAETKMSKQSANIYGGRVQVIFQHPGLSPYFVPFVALGDGFDRVVSPNTVLGSDTDWPVHAGAGAKIFLHPSIALRIDGRFLRAPSQQAPYHLNASLGEFMLGLTYRPGRAEEIVPPPPPPDPDSDGDGLLDSVDKCPHEPEDPDQFDDTDGCPDLDNDGDGLADAQDRCPLEAEDKDGWQDDDGCIDPDNDADGVADASDKCPGEPEDVDGFEDEDGCPELDNDRDGFADAQDPCPNEAETINGVTDDDGCPDKGNALVVISPDRLELLEPIVFKQAVLQKASFNVLGQIGATLRARREILRVRITVHVQPTKKPEADLRLSDQRAKAIRDWLVTYGIEAKRVEPRGFGGTKPLVLPSAKGAKAINERVELIILERE